MRASLRYVSPVVPETPTEKSAGYLDVATVFEKVFPDLSENSLGERREALLRQAEHYEKRKLHEQAYLNRLSFRSLETTLYGINTTLGC